MWLGSFLCLPKECAATDLLINTEQGVPVQENWPIRLVLFRKLCSYAALLYFVISSSTLSRSEIFPVFTSSSICTQSLTAAFNSSAAYWRDMGI